MHISQGPGALIPHCASLLLPKFKEYHFETAVDGGIEKLGFMSTRAAGGRGALVGKSKNQKRDRG